MGAELVDFSYKTIVFYTTIICIASILGALSSRSLISNNHEKPFKEYKSSKKTNVILISFSFGILWIVSSLRYDVGADYFSYIRMYNEISQLGLVDSILSLRSEPGFVLLNWLIAATFNNSQFIFVISSFLTIFLFYFSILENKDYINVGLAIFVFSVLFYFSSFTAIRLYIAVAIVFYSYKFLIDGKIKKYILAVLIAACFHYTAIGILPISFLAKKNFKRKNSYYYIVVLVTFVILSNFNSIMAFMFYDTKFSVYYTYYEHPQVNMIKVYLAVLPIIVLLSYYKKRLLKSSSHFDIYLKLFFTYIILMVVISEIPILDRFLTYLSVSQIILIPACFKVASKKEKPLVLLCIIYYLLAWLFWLELNYSPIIPYQLFF